MEDAAAEESELHPELHDGAQVPEGERLEDGHRGALVILPAELSRVAERAQAVDDAREQGVGHRRQRPRVDASVDRTERAGAVAAIDGLDLHPGEEALGIAPEAAHAGVADGAEDGVIDRRPEQRLVEEDALREVAPLVGTVDRDPAPRPHGCGAHDVGTGALGLIGNVLWFVFAGIWLFVGHIVSALACAITIIGIPFAIQHLKIALAALAPIGKSVVKAD